MPPTPDVHVIEPGTFIVLAIVALLVVAAVALWRRGTQDDREYAEWRRRDVVRASETRERIATMQSRRAGARLDGSAVDTGAMRKATL